MHEPPQDIESGANILIQKNLRKEMKYFLGFFHQKLVLRDTLYTQLSIQPDFRSSHEEKSEKQN